MQVQKPLAYTAQNSLRRGDIPQTGHWFGQNRMESKLTIRCGLPQLQQDTVLAATWVQWRNAFHQS